VASPNLAELLWRECKWIVFILLGSCSGSVCKWLVINVLVVVAGVYVSG
jgi:hypothetical protein